MPYSQIAMAYSCKVMITASSPYKARFSILFMKTLLWLDDGRDPKVWVKRQFDAIHWVKKYHDFVYWIMDNGLPDEISFDHDLSDIHCSKSTYKEKTGMDCAKWLVDYCLDNKVKLPEYNVHSANPTGAENIERILSNFKKFQNENI